MISITLNPRGMKPRTYRADIRIRECLDAYALADRWEQAAGKYEGELMEDALAFIPRCFGGQFTAEDLIDGYEGSPYALVPNFLRAVIGYVSEQLVDFPPRAAATVARG